MSYCYIKYTATLPASMCVLSTGGLANPYRPTMFSLYCSQKMTPPSAYYLFFHNAITTPAKPIAAPAAAPNTRPVSRGGAAPASDTDDDKAADDSVTEDDAA